MVHPLSILLDSEWVPSDLLVCYLTGCSAASFFGIVLDSQTRLFDENSVFGLRLWIGIAYAGGFACANLGIGDGRNRINSNWLMNRLSHLTLYHSFLEVLYINCSHLT